MPAVILCILLASHFPRSVHIVNVLVFTQIIEGVLCRQMHCCDYSESNYIIWTLVRAK